MNRTISVTSLGGSAFVIIALFFYYVALIFPSTALNFFALILLGSCVLFYLREMHLAIVNFIFIFSFLFSALAVVSVEFGVYLPEIQSFTFFSGAAAKNITLMVLFIVVMQSVTRWASNLSPRFISRIKHLDSLGLKTLPLVAFILVIIYITILIIYGSPLLRGVDRFFFWRSIAPGWFRYVHSLMPQLAFVIAFACCARKLSTAAASIWGIMAVLAVVAGGEKFSGLLSMLIFAAIPFFVMSDKRVKHPLRVILIFSILVVALLGVVLISYMSIYGDAFYDKLIVRLSLQGQMLWALDQRADFSAQELQVIVQALLGIGASDVESGMPYLMYLIAPSKLVDSYLSGGASFTAPFPANIQFFWGYYAAPLSIPLIAAAVGGVAGVLVLAIRARSIIFSLCVMKFYWFLYIAIAMGEIRMIFDWKFLLYAGVLMMIILLSVRESSLSRSAT